MYSAYSPKPCDNWWDVLHIEQNRVHNWWDILHTHQNRVIIDGICYILTKFVSILYAIYCTLAKTVCIIDAIYCRLTKNRVHNLWDILHTYTVVHEDDERCVVEVQNSTPPRDFTGISAIFPFLVSEQPVSITNDEIPWHSFLHCKHSVWRIDMVSPHTDWLRRGFDFSFLRWRHN